MKNQAAGNAPCSTRSRGHRANASATPRAHGACAWLDLLAYSTGSAPIPTFPQRGKGPADLCANSGPLQEGRGSLSRWPSLDVSPR
jgi:hypothetical protein